MLAFPILALTYFFAIGDPRMARDARLRSVYLLVLTFHHILAFINAEVSVLPGAEGDSEGFYAAAASPVEGANYDKLYYTQFLRFAFSFFGPSRLLAAEFSVFMFAVCCLLLVRILDEMGCSSKAAWAVFIFGSMPSILFHFSIPLRESFQGAAVSAVALAAVRLRTRFSLPSLILGGAGLVILGASHFHLSTMALGVGILSGLLVLRRTFTAFGLVVVGCSIVLFLAFYGATVDLDTEDTLASGVASVHDYREGVIYEKGRAFYGGQVDTSSLSLFVVSVSRLFIYYMTAPWPWVVSSVADLFAMLENTLRLWFIVVAIQLWRNAPVGATKEMRGYLIALFLFVELYWSLGTGNWGTAYRHHTVALVLLPVIAAVPAAGEMVASASRKPQSLREQIRRRRAAESSSDPDLPRRVPGRP